MWDRIKNLCDFLGQSIHPLSTDFGFGYVTYFDQWWGRECDKSRGIKCTCMA